MVQLSHLYMTAEKTIALTIHSFVGKVISLLLNMLSRFVIAFLPRSQHLLVSCLKLISLEEETANHCSTPAVRNHEQDDKAKYFSLGIINKG